MPSAYRPPAVLLDPSFWIRLLTIASLAGLLLAVGLRLTWAQVAAAVAASRIGAILIVNFALVPALALGLARIARLPEPIAAGMLLLGSAPFAPVVPVFARMARADLALAAGLTGLFPLLSAFLTPLVCAAALRLVGISGEVDFALFGILVVLLSTITLPLAVGVALRRNAPALGSRLLRPVEVTSEAIGAVSLAFVTFVELPSILETGWQALLSMALLFEATLLAGYLVGGSTTGARRVVALGTSNRNIALAILVALDGFSDTAVVAAVVANGLLLILLGLVHVAIWRFTAPDPADAAAARAR
jgi:BASS family bile acid:Na+ symporter